MRKEVNLDEDVIELLQKLADKKDWSLKKYMEHVLKLYAKKANKVFPKAEADYKALAKKIKLPIVKKKL